MPGPHVPDVRRARPVRRLVARRAGQRGRELGAVRVLRPVPADGGHGHRGPRRQGDGRAQQRGGRLRGLVLLVRRPVPCRASQDQAAGRPRVGRVPGTAVPRLRLQSHQGERISLLTLPCDEPTI